MTALEDARTEAREILTQLFPPPLPPRERMPHIPAHGCVWCGRRIHPARTACNEHRDLDALLLRHQEAL